MHLEQGAGDRFIPAHAGNTGRSSPSIPIRAVHPRACGEHLNRTAQRSASSGSSPRMRGTHGHRRRRTHLHRFIPAHAGNTIQTPTRSSSASVHPRACGERGKALAPGSARPGSSPRVRGTRWRRRELRRVVRFIPARAGNTPTLRLIACPTPVHPRACGEHGITSSYTSHPIGSSPRVRGTQQETRFTEKPVRFIPARAGNTTGAAAGTGSGAVHPRACGEHVTGHAIRARENGSSPRVRGTRRQPIRERAEARFIPARAGNTSAVAETASVAAVHPRACGEHLLRKGRFDELFGSSPRVRGTPFRQP